ncbi:MAG TPA: ATP-binding protein [Bacteroidales bacterium]|nr:ATP-binding protein [Bacteroidales bacterium]HRZ48962.1 ATP-binding protein [Bacteroidales bacterium]
MKTENPFKFGTVAHGPYFTNRSSELQFVAAALNGANHLVVISPRRYGKTSMIHQALQLTDRPKIELDLMMVTSTTDFAAQLLKQVYKIYPFQRIKGFIQQFKVIPVINLNPVTNTVEITFSAEAAGKPVLDDVLNLIENLASADKRSIVVLDEFQEIHHLDRKLAPGMRSVMQHHKNINYILMGSQESMMREIFEQKKSPFYHFGLMMNLDRIPHDEFESYLSKGLEQFTPQSSDLARSILEKTGSHPYYTQQLGWFVWEQLRNYPDHPDPVNSAIENIEAMHDLDYERMWNNLNKTDQKLILGLIHENTPLLSGQNLVKYGIGASSTAFSAIKRLMHKGYIIKAGQQYVPEDPFFAGWLLKKRGESII